MMKKVFVRVCLLIVLSICFAVPLSAKQETAVSPALHILAAQNSVAKAGLVGEDIVFSADDFEKALNISTLSAVTVSELPAKTDGILYLGGSEVSEGQLVSTANLSHLRFVFSGEDVTDSSFCFSTNLGAYEIRCDLYALKYENAAPVILTSEATAVSVSTYKNVTVHNRMEAYDPDGDAMVFEILSFPQNGKLTVTDRTTGEYHYTPNSGYTGEDSFRYVVADKYGNYSSSAEVSLSVTSQRNSLVYGDMERNASHVAAISLTEQGIMTATELDGSYYFQPDAEVSRAEFLTMVMKCMEIEPIYAEKTVFSDDADILAEHRSYVDTAQRLGHVCGKLNEAGELIFAPNDAITRAEAATILQNMMDLDVPVFKPFLMDANTVPVWAKDAVYALSAAGILEHDGGYVSGDSAVTKDVCAEMLYRLRMAR